MKKIVFIPLLLISIIVIFFFWDNLKPSKKLENFNERKIRNLEFKGNYYLYYKVSGEPYDIIHIFYNEFDFYNTDTKMDSAFRFIKISSNHIPNGTDIVVSAFEFGKVGSKYVAARYQLGLVLYPPFYHVVNTFTKQFIAKNGIEKFAYDFYSGSHYDFYNSKISEREVDSDGKNRSKFFVEYKTLGQYTRIRIPENFDLTDSITDGNRKLKWIFENVEKEFGFDLSTWNEIVK